MTDFLDISLTNLEPGDPLTDDIAQAGLWQNLLAFAEQSAGGDGAPINQAMWHPYNAVRVGDGNLGVIYDGPTAGATASVETPTFEDGYEYELRIRGFQTNAATGQVAQIELFREITGTYSSAISFAGSGGSIGTNTFDADVTFARVRVPTLAWAFPSRTVGRNSNGGTLIGGSPATVSHVQGTKQAISKARLSLSSGNLPSVGTAALYRRRELEV